MNYLNPIPIVEKWTRKNHANNLIISFCCLFLLLLSSSSNAQTILCPQDLQVSVDPNQCDAVVDFEVTFENPACAGMAFTQSVDNSTVTMSIGCFAQLGSQHIRVFDLNALGITGPLALESIDLGVGSSPAGAPITLNFYTLNGAVDYTNMTLIGSQAVTLPALFNSVHNIPVAVTAPAGSQLVVEVVVPAGPNVTLVGYNSAGQTAPSYYASQGASLDLNTVCGYAQPVDANTLGFGTFNLVMTLNSNPMNTITQIAGLPTGATFPMGVTTNTFTLSDACGNTDDCTFNVTVVDDVAPVIACPTLAPVYLANGECDAAVDYNISATDNCDNNPALTLISGVVSGATFQVGSHAIAYQAIDASGNIATCNFTIEVLGSSNVGGALGCSNVSIPLGSDCEIILDPLTLLLSGYDCSQTYSTYAVAANGDIIGDVIDGAYVGQTLQVIVAQSGGNKCWGYVTVVDNIVPTITCSDVTVLCNDSTDIPNIDNPAYSDNCSHVYLTHTDVVTDGICIDIYNRVIERTWTATDAAGNTASCVQTINLSGVDISTVDFPGNYDDVTFPHIECNSNVGTTPATTGIPLINGQPIINGDICGLTVDYTDSHYDLCGGSYKILRNWEIFDFCENLTVNHTQIIKVLDTDGPILSCPSTIQLPTSPNACSATFIIPTILATDDCSGVTVSVTTPDGYTFPMNGGTGVNLSLGLSTFTYHAVDACGNQSSCTLDVEVFDNVPPVPICDAFTTISLNEGGFGHACATTFDDGSYDNCGDVVLKIKRIDAAASVDYTDCVDFTCGDVGSNILVNMRVYDIIGTFGEEDPTARYNECMVEVLVADNVAPIITCADDITITCEQDPTDLSIVGVSTATDICGVHFLEFSDVDNRDECGAGDLERTYTVNDFNGNAAVACVQTITFIDVTPINVIFPNDYAVNNCIATGELIPENLPNGFNFPILLGEDCELVGVHFDDELLALDPDACFQIHRHWKVVEWCKYDANDPNENGVTRHTQVIEVTDNVAPVIIAGCDDLEFCSYDEDCQTGLAELFVQATDDCLMPELLDYRYTIDLNSDGVIDASANTTVATGNYPYGNHSITWTVTDGCGNETSCTKSFSILDCKKPTPVCINGLSIDLQPVDQSVSIVPLDLESGSSFDNCTLFTDLNFSFSSDTNDQSLTFTCADIGTQIVEVWITDATGNQDFCQTYVIVQDNNNACQVGQNAEISGYIQTEDADLVENVDVEIMNSNALPYTTTADGQFAFPSVLLNNNYTVQPKKDIHPLNGVTTLDLVLIQQHILGVGSLNSPYKIIAADANGSNTITTLDIVTLRRLILGIDQNFQSNTSWRFVDMDFVFPIPTNPFASAFPEQIDFNNIAASELATDFVGVKIGDVNGTAIPNNLLGASLRTTNGALNFNLKDQTTTAGESIIVDFKSSDFKNILGYQFTIDFDVTQLEIIDVIPGALENLSTENFGLVNAQEGMITSSWNSGAALDMDEDAILFSLVFQASENVLLSEVLNVSSRMTKAESYDNNAEVMDVVFNFENQVSTTEFEVYQNTPNPFTTNTTIAFNLPQADEVTLTITNVAGKVLKVITGNYTKGNNTIEISANELNGAGVMIYRLDSGDFTTTKKMIHLK